MEQKEPTGGASDVMLKLDKLQSSKHGIVCPHDPDHGRLGVARGGSLVCGASHNKRQGVFCDGFHPVDSGLLEYIDTLGL